MAEQKTSALSQSEQETAVLRGIAEGDGFDDLIARPGVTRAVVMTIINRYRLIRSVDGGLHAPPEHELEFDLVLAEHSRNSTVRNKAARIRAARADLHSTIARLRATGSSRSRTAAARDRQLAALANWRATLRDLIAESDELARDIRAAGPGGLPRFLEQQERAERDFHTRRTAAAGDGDARTA